MWLGKFLDLQEGIPKELKDKLAKNIGQKKLSPLEFSILESIFNAKQMSKYDLIEHLNKTFAGTFKAKKITIYPLLSKLKRRGLLNSKNVKSPAGPLIKVYVLTDAGEELLKTKVNKNFASQLEFTKNFLIEMSSIYIQSFPAAQQEDMTTEVKKLLRDSLEAVINGIPLSEVRIKHCPQCKTVIETEDSSFCSNCGYKL